MCCTLDYEILHTVAHQRKHRQPGKLKGTNGRFTVQAHVLQKAETQMPGFIQK